MKDLSTVLSVISAFASLLSIIFDVPKKISISLKWFILILSILCALFFWFTSIGSNSLQAGNNDELSSIQPPKMNDTVENNYTDSPANDSEDVSHSINDSSPDSSINAPASVPNNISSITPTDSPLDGKILKIDPIISNAQNVASITQVPSEVLPVQIVTLVGEVYEKNQDIDYEFMPEISGRHRFEFSDVPDGMDLCLEVYNSGWERIDYSSNLDNGDGLTVSLNAEELYYIRVKQYNNFGHYALNIGIKKPVVDVSTFTTVSDSIQYTDQQNDYSFSPSLSGRYRFEFSNVPDGTDLWLIVYNSGWERIEQSSNLDNGDGISLSLDAGNLYYIRVEQYNKIGTYTLNIGMKKPVVDISAFTTVSDSIQYTDQQNDYSFSPSLSGRYRFEFSNVPDGTDLWLIVYNSGWERIDQNSNLDNGDGISVSLDAGNLYYIQVEQYNNYDSYALNVIRENN